MIGKPFFTAIASLFLVLGITRSFAACAIPASGGESYTFKPIEPESWQIYTNGVEYPLDAVISHQGNATKRGSYFWLPKGKTAGFGSLSVSGVEWTWGCAFSNASDVVIREIDLRVAAGQWGGSNLKELNDALNFEWAKTSGGDASLNNDALEWRSLASALFKPQSTASGLEEYPIIQEPRKFKISREVAPGDILLFRFTDISPSSGGNASLGIYLFEVDFKSLCGFEIVIEELSE